MSTLQRRTSNRLRKETERAKESREAKEEELNEFSFSRGKKRKQKDAPPAPGPSKRVKLASADPTSAPKPREYQDPFDDGLDYRSDTAYGDEERGTSVGKGKGKGKEKVPEGPKLTVRIPRPRITGHTAGPDVAASTSVILPPSESSARVSPAVTDRLLALESRMDQLEKDVGGICASAVNSDETHTVVEAMGSDLHSVITNELALRKRVDGTLDQLNKVLGDIHNHGLELVRIWEKIGGGVEQGKRKKGGAKDNEFNTTVRRTFYLAMGVSESCHGRDLPTDFEAGGGWISDPDDDTQQLLRPDFTRGFKENSIWHEQLVQFVREKAPTLVETMTKERINEVSRARIIDQMESAWKGLSGKYRVHLREVELRKKGEVVPYDKQSAVLNRRNGRKDRKMRERRKHRPSNMGENWDHFFQRVYQSTDESDGEMGVIDVDTEEERRGDGGGGERGTSSAPSKKKSSGGFKTHPPSYRSEQVTEGIAKIDAKIAKSRKRGQSNAIESIRLEPKDKPLPMIGVNGLRIPKDAVDRDWLKEHPEFRDPEYMVIDGMESESEEETEGGDENEG